MTAFPFDNSYARDLEGLWLKALPARASDPKMIRFNHGLADELGLDVSALTEAELAAIFSGNQIPEHAHPLAMAYAGHQFGHFSPQLGDGRAILLGEVIDRNGLRRDIQLKGPGRTPFSRSGDGRAALPVQAQQQRIPDIGIGHQPDGQEHQRQADRIHAGVRAPLVPS